LIKKEASDNIPDNIPDSIPISGSLPMIIFFFINFNFAIMYFVSRKLYGNLK
jgi:hypothetical protein